MNVLLVSAYPEPASFGGRLIVELAETLQAQGHQVFASDLHRQQFPAICFSGSFHPRANEDFFDLQAEQRYAFLAGTFPELVQAEQKKLRDSDAVIFLGPIYWASPPAIMRGWFEQVLTPGFAYDQHRCYETGLLKGKSAFFVVTHAGKLGAATPQGTAASVHALLAPLEDRPFHYSGFETLPALDIHPPPYDDAAACAAAFNKLIAGIMTRLDEIAKRPAPKRQPHFPLIHINGRPGIGKKTIGEALARIAGGVLIDNHTLLNPGLAACGRGSDGYYRINRAVRHAVFEELLHEITHHPVILSNALTDQVAEHRETYEEVKLLAHKAHAPLLQVVLTAAFEENARRLECPARGALKLTDRSELQRLYNSYTIITPEDAIVIDTTDLQPEDSAVRIFDLIHREHIPSAPRTAP